MGPGPESIEDFRARAKKRRKATEAPVEEAPPIVTPDSRGEAAAFSRRGVATNQALGTGETILATFSSTHQTLTSPFLPATQSRVEPFQFGWGKIQFYAGTGVSASRVSGAQGDGSNESVLGFVSGGFKVTSGNRELAYVSAYDAKDGGHSFASLTYDFGYGFPDSGGNEQGTIGSGQMSGYTQQLAFSGNYFFPGLRRLVLGCSLSIDALSGINRDVGTDTERSLATAAVTASYELSRKRLSMPKFRCPFAILLTASVRAG